MLRQIVRRTFVSKRFLCTPIDDEITINDLKPSKEFIKSLPRDLKKKYEKTIAELEIFIYMGKFVPKSIEENEWRKSLEFESLSEKVSFWEFLAVRARRRELKDRRQTNGAEVFRKFMDEQTEKFEKGEMGYGPEMYQLVHNPMRNKRKLNNVEGCRIYNSMVTEMPKIALDLQFVEKMSDRHRSELGNQMQYVISENFAAKRPLLLNFVNLPSEQFAEEWMAKSIGYYGGMYQHQTILPDYTTKGIKETFPNDKNIVYISHSAREVLDGPLTADVIGICVSMDHRRESIGAARRAGIRAVRLPIHRYVKWKSGPQFLPFPNIMNTLREVYENGGDWSTALHNNISKRHLIDVNEDEKKRIQALRRKTKDDERNELIEAIRMATEG